MPPLRHQERVFSPDVKPVAEPVGNEEEGAVFRKVFRFLQEVDSGLQDRAAATFHLHPTGDVLRRHVSLVVGLGIAKHDLALGTSRDML